MKSLNLSYKFTSNDNAPPKLGVFLLATLALTISINGCSASKTILVGGTALAPRPYCSTTTPYPGSITVSGTAYFAYRVDGNQEVADGGMKLTPDLTKTSFTVTVGSNPYSITTGAGPTSNQVTTGLANLINANLAELVTAASTRINGSYFLILNPKNYDEPPWAFSATANNLTTVYRANARPIRYAEVEARDASGNIIQCGTTNATGGYSLSLPAGTGNYTIAVNSRMLSSSKGNNYVLNNPVDNLHHSKSIVISASANSSNKNILAPGDGTLEGAAFHILDQFLNANEYLMSKLTGPNGCGTTFSECLSMTGAPPLLRSYWTKGASPADFFNGGAPDSSFYVSGESELYILGGLNGNVDIADTDHFDNSVILHEYGHFLEDVYSIGDSPGGQHNVNELIDPRLAWSEGWSNFFQAAVTGNPRYVDTSGNSSGTDSELLNLSVEVGTYLAGSGAGLFDEFAITRFLWDALDGAADGADAVGGQPSSFAEIWSSFTGTVLGMASPSHKFRHSGTFLKIQDSHLNKTDWSGIRGMQSLNNNSTYNATGFREYATPIAFGSTPCNSNIFMPLSYTGDPYDYRRHQDHFRLDHPGGSVSVNLSYTTASSANLNLKIFAESHQLWGEGVVASSASGASGQPEQISTRLSAGSYLITVERTSGGPATYSLSINGNIVCPQFD